MAAGHVYVRELALSLISLPISAHHGHEQRSEPDSNRTITLHAYLNVSFSLYIYIKKTVLLCILICRNVCYDLEMTPC